MEISAIGVDIGEGGCSANQEHEHPSKAALTVTYILTGKEHNE